MIRQYIHTCIGATQVCRHLDVAINNTKSEALRDEVDAWFIEAVMNNDTEDAINVLSTYSRCRTNMTLYVAANIARTNDFMKVI